MTDVVHPLAAGPTTGETNVVVVKNGNGNGRVWMWMIGTIITVGVIVSAGVVTIKTDIATMKADIGHMKTDLTTMAGTIATERGLANRLDRDQRENRERIIKLERD